MFFHPFNMSLRLQIISAANGGCLVVDSNLATGGMYYGVHTAACTAQATWDPATNPQLFQFGCGVLFTMNPLLIPLGGPQFWEQFIVSIQTLTLVRTASGLMLRGGAPPHSCLRSFHMGTQHASRLAARGYHAPPRSLDWLGNRRQHWQDFATTCGFLMTLPLPYP